MAEKWKQCWSCGAVFVMQPGNDRYCPQCGADTWPQPPDADAASASSDAVLPVPVPATRDYLPMIAAGVGIIATLLLYAVWFWVWVGLIGVLSPPQPSVYRELDPTFSDYVTPSRLAWSAVLALPSVAGSWAVAYGVIRTA